MARREFPRSVRVAVIKRATRDSVVYCEKCGAQAKRFQIDHVIADAHGGEPVLANAELICEPCFTIKNPEDTTIAAKIKRREAAHVGAKTAPVVKIKSAPFPKSTKPRHERQSLPRRAMFTEIV